jgi:hypothetical protein
MPSHFSSIGFPIETEEDLEEIAPRMLEGGEIISVKQGQYVRWTGAAGEEMWWQLQEDAVLGVNPHFAGKSSTRIALQSRIQREEDTTDLDGAFQAWMPAAEGGAEYPFVFDSPDALTYGNLEIPALVDVQITAFAHELSCHASVDAYEAAQPNNRPKLASRSFIPIGLFAPDGAKAKIPEAHATFAGDVVEAATYKNALTGLPYYWALVDTLGARFDVVADPTLLDAAPVAGNVLAGSFWLSGRLTSYRRREPGWFGKLRRGSS